VTAVASESQAGRDAWTRRRTRIGREIERAALELFAVDGPDGVTVEQIAAAAGISVRTFFRYFPSRDDIMFALPRRQVDDLCARVASRPRSESVLEAFIAAVHEVQHDFADAELLRLWGRAVDHWSVAPASPQPGAGMVVAYGEVISDRLGVPPDDLRVEVTATALSSVMWLAFLRWLKGGEGGTLPDVVERCFAVLRDLDRYAKSGPGGR
jgi:AcrR family transcriptional regulator